MVLDAHDAEHTRATGHDAKLPTEINHLFAAESADKIAGIVALLLFQALLQMFLILRVVIREQVGLLANIAGIAVNELAVFAKSATAFEEIHAKLALLLNRTRVSRIVTVVGMRVVRHRGRDGGGCKVRRGNCIGRLRVSATSNIRQH